MLGHDTVYTASEWNSVLGECCQPFHEGFPVPVFCPYVRICRVHSYKWQNLTSAGFVHHTDADPEILTFSFFYDTYTELRMIRCLQFSDPVYYGFFSYYVVAYIVTVMNSAV